MVVMFPGMVSGQRIVSGWYDNAGWSASPGTIATDGGKLVVLYASGGVELHPVLHRL